MVRIKHYSLLLLSVLILIFMSTLLTNSIYTINTCIVHVDPLLNSACAALITGKIKELCYERPTILFSRMKNDFPCITHFSCRYDARHILTVHIGVARPLFRLNTTSLVLENKTCVATNWYTPVAYNHSASISAPHDTALDQLIAFVEKLPPSLGTRFEYDWKTDFTIYAHDSHHKGSSLLASKNVVPTVSTVAAYDEIINNIKKYAVPGEHVNEKWIADARFDNQLIFSTQKGGENYGNSI